MCLSSKLVCKLFKTNMWSKLPNENYYIMYKSDVLIEIFVTDFISIWSKHYTPEDFLSCIKESNCGLEIDDSKLLANVVDMMENIETAKKITVTKNNDALVLHSLKNYGYPVRLSVALTEGPKQLFFHKVTHPLLETVQDLKNSQKDLCNLLMKKDKEIREYKDEGGKIALRHLKTPLFNQESHMSLHRQYSKHFKFDEFSEDMLNRVDNYQITFANKPSSQDIKPKASNSSTNISNSSTNQSESEETEAKTNIKPEDLSSTSSALSVSDVKVELNSQSTSVSPRKKKKVFNL